MEPGTSNTCSNGHYYYGSNVMTDQGAWRCRACYNDMRRRSAARERAKRAAERGTGSETDTRWRDQAGCLGADPSLFEPVTKPESRLCAGEPSHLDRVQEALSYCDRCPVRARCSAWAKASGEQGVWGGEYLSREGRSKKGAAA
jgi:hypothetical protein